MKESINVGALTNELNEVVQCTEDYTSRAGRNGAGFEVLNAGVGGYNTYQELIHLQEIGLRLSPDLILLQFTLNDAGLSIFRDSRNSGWLIRFKEWIKTHLSLYGFLRLHVRESVDWAYSSNSDGHRVSGEVVPLQRATRGENSEGWKVCRQSLKDIATLARARSVPVMMVIFPLLADNLDNGYPFKAEHELVAKTAKENQMVVLDLLDEFRPNAPSELRQNRVDWEHPSAHGHLIAAEAIYKELVARALVPVWSCPD